MGAWEDYLAAAQRLDAARRDAATLAAERSAVAKAGRAELAGARQRLSAQRARLLDLATRLGVPAPRVAVDATEVAGARAALAGTGAPNPGAAAVALLRANRSTIDTVDAELSTLTSPQPAGLGSSRGRNLLVYAIAGLVATIVPVLLIMVAPSDPSMQLRYYTLFFGGICAGVIFPLLGFGLAWSIIGSLARTPGQPRAGRDTALGALVTAACVIVVYGVAFLANIVG